MAHALQSLCDGRAGCPARALQLVICRSGGFTGTVTLSFQLVVSLDWYVLVGFEDGSMGFVTERVEEEW